MWTPDGRYFVFVSVNDKGPNIWVLPERRGFLQKRPRTPLPLTTGPLGFSSPLPSRDGSKVFVVGTQPRGELVRYDARSQQFVPYLSGISASELDFSRDGQWVTYITYPDKTLWRCRTDGSDCLQLTYAPAEVHVPRWSPDGKQIAFIAVRNNKWKIFLISTEGGTPQELIPEDKEEEDDPVWSPDGTQLAFGRVNSFGSSEPIAIQLVDLKTHQVSTLSGSEGLYSPRWSPDGRYLATLSRDSQKLLFFDFKAEKWSEPLTENQYIGFPTWSPNSKYLYFDTFSSFRRATVGSIRSEELFGLQGTHRFIDYWLGPWSGLAPDGSPLFTRDISVQEIYALDVQWP